VISPADKTIHLMKYPQQPHIILSIWAGHAMCLT
jgi:hypothetical protein